jgi:hypothetical protein
VASPILASSWEHFPVVVWAAPSFVLSHTMSHWSSGSTICFLPQGAAVHAPGVQLKLRLPHLLATSC